MDTTTPPQPPPPTERQLRLGAVIRDVAIIVALTFVVGFALVVTAPVYPPRGMLAIIASTVAVGTVGFAISGCLAPGKRWRHLAYVALGVWLAALMNVMFFDSTVVEWLFGAPVVALMMGLGGVISYLFKKDTKPPA
jgi:hypothetical protein